MVKAVNKFASDIPVFPSPGLKDAPVLDLLCSHFVMALAGKQGARFNVRRDFNGLLPLTGKYLVWPLPVLTRLREFLGRRCKDNEFWRGHEALDMQEFMERHGVWRGPYEEGTLFFYLDEYAKDLAKVAARLAADETMHWTALSSALGRSLPGGALSFGA